MIHFHYEETPYRPKEVTNLKNWLTKSARKEGYSIKELNYIFCSDNYLLQINKEHLNHNYFTDIITFDNSEEKGKLEGDIFISVDRVKDNALSYEEPFSRELKRVMIHGLLHLMGYKDKTTEEKALMRSKEDFYIQQKKGSPKKGPI